MAPPEGVHLRMPAAIYEEARALGAEDLRLLYWDATSWWAQSEHNPYRRAPRRLARRHHRNLGDALRLLVTRGEGAYQHAFAIEPDDGRSDWARTRDEIKALLATKAVKIPHGDFSERTMWSLVRKHGLAHKVFAVARADYEAARRAGRRHISEEDDRRLRDTARLIIAHKELGPALTGGLCETAVFWRREEDPDTLLCARFDYLRSQRIFDIQKVAPAGARDIDGAIRRTIEEGDLEIARRLLPEAWARLCAFVADGAVYAWDGAGERAVVLRGERELLQAYVDAGEPQWVWVFCQLPVDEIGAERGAVVAPRWHTPQGRIWDAGGEKIETALQAYRDFRKRFAGFERSWAKVDEAKELTDADIRVRLKKELV